MAVGAIHAIQLMAVLLVLDASKPILIDEIRYYSFCDITPDLAFLTSGSKHWAYPVFNSYLGKLGVCLPQFITAINFNLATISGFLLSSSLLEIEKNSRRAAILLFALFPLFPQNIAWYHYNIKDYHVQLGITAGIFLFCFLVNRSSMEPKFALKDFKALFMIPLLIWLLFIRSYIAILFIGFSILIFSYYSARLKKSMNSAFRSLIFLLSNVSVLMIISLVIRLVYSKEALGGSFSITNFTYILTPLPFNYSDLYANLALVSLLQPLLLLISAFIALKEFKPRRHGVSFLLLIIMYALVLCLPYIITGQQLGPRYRITTDNLFASSLVLFFLLRVKTDKNIIIA